MASRKILAVNHVFSILLDVSQYGNWEKAFLDTIPSRKGASQKNEEDQNEEIEETEATIVCIEKEKQINEEPFIDEQNPINI